MSAPPPPPPHAASNGDKAKLAAQAVRIAKLEKALAEATTRAAQGELFASEIAPLSADASLMS